MEQDTKKTEQKELDFSLRDDFEKAKDILINEGFDIKYALHLGDLFPYMVMGGTEEKAQDAFKFTIDRGWPTRSLSKIWLHGLWNKNKDVKTSHYELSFCQK